MATVQEKIVELKERIKRTKLGGGQDRINKQHTAGKFTARERIEKLLDPGIFVELGRDVVCRYSSSKMKKEKILTDGVVTGYGTIGGRLVYVFAQDFTIQGGSLGEMHAAKIVKIQKLSLKMGAPCIGINDSGGARIQEGVDALSGFGDIFFHNVMASGVVPQISVIMGPCAGGAVYSPALMDFVFMVEKTSQMFITGPQVIKSVTAEEVTAEQLGGAVVHNTTSGVAHFISKNDTECINQIRKLLSFLPNNNMENAPSQEAISNIHHHNEKLNMILPDNPNQPYNMLEIITEIVDNGEFLESLKGYAQNIVTCFARINSQTVGIIANQPTVMAGCLDINASNKGARFIRFCDAFNIPILHFVDVPGFLPGVTQEHAGIIKHGAKLLYANAEATVPKITIIIRKAYGGAYLAMCCKQLGADVVMAWPTAEIAVMGPSGAANIIFRNELDIKIKIEEYINEFATPYKAAERGYVDMVIEPKETRGEIITALNMLQTKSESRFRKKHGNIPL